MSDVGLPSVGAIICPLGLGSPPKFGFGGGGGPTTSSGGGDFLLPLRARALPSLSPWAWGALACVPVVMVAPTCFPTGTPNGKPSAAPRVLVPLGAPAAAPPANA